MRGIFEYALRYRVEVTCKTPLRTGSEDCDPQSILLRRDGTPFLQGTSLAGALKGWKKNVKLFGEESKANDRAGSKEGAVAVSDLIFDKASTTVMRPRLQIDGRTGSAADGKKFDVLHLQTGTKGEFTLVWCGSKAENEDVKQQLEEYLSALNDGLIRLGGQKSNGFGRVSIQVERKDYDLKKKKDRKAWLTDSTECSEKVTLQHLDVNEQITFHVTMKTRGLLVKGRTPDGVGKGSLKAVQIRENSICVIPGSSLKGAVRAQARRIAPFLQFSDEQLDELFGKKYSESDNGIAGKVIFSDACFIKPTISHASRIRVNRFTGGTIRQSLFTEEVIGGECSYNITIPETEQTGALLVLYTLRDLGIGLYSLGSDSAIGRGRIEYLKVDIRAQEGTAVMECRQKQVTVRDEVGIINAWKQTGDGDK